MDTIPSLLLRYIVRFLFRFVIRFISLRAIVTKSTGESCPSICDQFPDLKTRIRLLRFRHVIAGRIDDSPDSVLSPNRLRNSGRNIPVRSRTPRRTKILQTAIAPITFPRSQSDANVNCIDRRVVGPPRSIVRLLSVS